MIGETNHRKKNRDVMNGFLPSISSIPFPKHSRKADSVIHTHVYLHKWFLPSGYFTIVLCYKEQIQDLFD